MTDRPAVTSRPSLKAWLRWAYDHWATRSLAAGAVATVMDFSTLILCVRTFRLPNPVSAMIGVTVGATFTFFANRHFAFRDHNPKLAPQAIRFAVSTFIAMLIHASLVWLLADHWRIPVVLAKLMADVSVFSVGQLLILRYVVFPKHEPTSEAGRGEPKEPPIERLRGRASSSSPG